MADDNGKTVSMTAAARSDSVRTGGAGEMVPRPPRVPLGAELPLFCERCGYSLNALPQVRCDHCELLQFHCPECGHHQPINTLRPAMQRTLGRMRAFSVGAIAFFKLNWFGWHLFIWVLMGLNWAYNYNRQTQSVEPLSPTFDAVLAFTMYGAAIGFVSRLLLLRWRSGALVGVVLAALFCSAMVLGFHWSESSRGYYGGGNVPGNLITPGRTAMVLLTFVIIAGSAAAAWPVWVGFVRVVMPERAGSALLEWQRSLSDETPTARRSDQP